MTNHHAADDPGTPAGHLSPAPATHGSSPDTLSPTAAVGGELRPGRGATPAIPFEESRDPALQPGGEAGSLADRQAGLVAALTSGSRVPEGFDARLVEIARVALLRKRAGEVAKQWPLLAAGLGAGWTRAFAGWAAARPTQGSLRDGWDLARELAMRGELPELAGAELAVREATMVYDGLTAPRNRRAPALRTAAGTRVVQIAGTAHVIRRP